MARREEILTQRRRDAEEAWPVVRLGDVCEEMRERIPSSNVSLECYITTDNMVKGCGGVRIADNVPEAVGLVRYQKGDVLLSNIRPYLKKSWLADRDGGCSSDVIVFRSLHSDLSPEYLFRVLSQDGFFDYSMQNVSGTKMPRGKRDWIKAFQFPLPPLPIQREIVARLEKELGEADKLAAKFKRVAELADDAFKAELDETFRAVDGEKVRLGDICEFVYGFPFDSKLFNEDNRGEPLIRIRDVVPGRTETYTTEMAPIKYRVCNGDLLVGMDGDFNLHRWESGPALLNQRVCMFKPHIDKLDVGYISHCLGEFLRKIWERKPFSTVKHLSAKDLNAIFVVLPSLVAQRAIVAKLDAAKERCERMKSAAMRGLAAAENLRKAILAEAFEQ